MKEISKELGSDELEVFIFHVPGKQMDDKYQYAPMHFLFDIKQEDLRIKAWLFLGGHVIDPSEHLNYASTVQYFSTRLLLTIVDNNWLKVMSGDVGNKFPNANTKENLQ